MSDILDFSRDEDLDLSEEMAEQAIREADTGGEHAAVVIEEDTAEAKPKAKKGRKVKQVKQVDAADAAEAQGAQSADSIVPKVRLVRMVGFSTTSSILSPEGFNVSLLSVAGRQYTFESPSDCLHWLTRRVYNGEPLSPEVEELRQALASAQIYRNVFKRLTTLEKSLNEADPSKPRQGLRFSRSAESAAEALASTRQASETAPTLNTLTARLDRLHAALGRLVELGEADAEQPVESGQESAVAGEYGTALTEAREALQDAQSTPVTLGKLLSDHLVAG
jgi:hypothetical protein